ISPIRGGNDPVMGRAVELGWAGDSERRRPGTAADLQRGRVPPVGPDIGRLPARVQVPRPQRRPRRGVLREQPRDGMTGLDDRIWAVRLGVYAVAMVLGRTGHSVVPVELEGRSPTIASAPSEVAESPLPWSENALTPT